MLLDHVLHIRFQVRIVLQVVRVVAERPTHLAHRQFHILGEQVRQECLDTSMQDHPALRCFLSPALRLGLVDLRFQAQGNPINADRLLAPAQLVSNLVIVLALQAQFGQPCDLRIRLDDARRLAWT